MKYEWPLNVSGFTWRDRLKICQFFLNPDNLWTQGSLVKQFEKKMAAKVGAKYALFVSSGSTANTLLAMYLRDNPPPKKQRKVIVLPAVTWQTSISPWIREGFEPHFIDVDLDTLCMDLVRLEGYLEKNKHKVACVFPTSLLGFSPNLQILQNLSYEYGVRVILDNCENLFSYVTKGGALQNTCSLFTSTTSTYFAHQIVSGDGGFVFTNYEHEYVYMLMARNHGMVRSLTDYSSELGISEDDLLNLYGNDDVDKRFDFRCLGNNYRNNDIHAFIGMLDLARWDEYVIKRLDLYSWFALNLDPLRYLLPRPKVFLDPSADMYGHTEVPFALPIIAIGENARKRIEDVKRVLGCHSIETRPLISGNLLRHHCYLNYKEKAGPTPVADQLHESAIYVGLHSKLDREDILKLTNILNRL